MKSRQRIVFDTNALISAAILTRSMSITALSIAVEHFEIVNSKDAWQEFDTRIQRPKLFHYVGSDQMRDDIVIAIIQALTHVLVRSNILDCTDDPNDNKFLALVA